MSEIKVLKCQSCGGALSRKDEYKPNWFECPSCGSLNSTTETVPTKEPDKPKTIEELSDEVRKAFKDFMYPD